MCTSSGKIDALSKQILQQKILANVSLLIPVEGQRPTIWLLVEFLHSLEVQTL